VEAARILDALQAAISRLRDVQHPMIVRRAENNTYVSVEQISTQHEQRGAVQLVQNLAESS
jgi:hypothetical protein